jgi:molecular chaperone GrpE
MSGEPSQDDPKAAEPVAAATEPVTPPAAAPSPNDSGGVIAVEVDAPDVPSPVVEAPPPPDPVVELEKKIATLEKEKKDNWDKYLRTAADVENLRKRQKRELDDTKFETKNKVLKEMLPVVDNLERAVEHASKGEDKNPIVEGVALVLRQFTTAFERLDVHPIDAMGQPFDPNQHEAISQQDSDLAPGTIVQVLQRGYRAGDRLLRPALVVVAKAKASAE